MNKNLKIALVLSGGGAKGAYQAGVIKSIQDRLNLQFEVVAGVSVGNLNGAMVAQGKYDQLEEIWVEIREKDVFKKNGLIKTIWHFITHKIGIGKAPFGLYDNRPLRKLIKKYIKYEDFLTDFLTGRVSLNSRDYEATTNADDYIDHILASTAIPVVFPPIDIDGQHWVDGGIRNVTPLADVLSYDPDLIIIIPTQWYKQFSYGHRKDGKVLDIADVAERTIGIMMNETFMNDLDQLIRINEIVGQAEKKGVTLTKENGDPFEFYECLIIPPTKNMGKPLDFSHDKIIERYEHGLKRGRKSARTLKDLLEKLN